MKFKRRGRKDTIDILIKWLLFTIKVDTDSLKDERLSDSDRRFLEGVVFQSKETLKMIVRKELQHKSGLYNR